MNELVAPLGLFVLGLAGGALANLAVYQLAWNRRAISPWSAPPPAAPPRRWSDRIPVLGWLGLRRESSLHGGGFWVRPAAVELLFGIGLVALWHWEVDQGRLAAGWARPGTLSSAGSTYAAHAILLWLMLVASLIDMDEKTIPDEITVPGTLVGLVLAAVLPWSLMPIPWFTPEGIAPGFITTVSPQLPARWPGWLERLSEPWTVGVAVGCWLLWCVALLHRTWYSRHGWRRAMGLALARIIRARSTPRIAGMAVVGTVGIAGVYWLGGDRWIALFSSLVGAAAGGGMIWLVRVLGTAALKREAMGFGDVTLMAMLGAFLGWQACLVIFFLAPLAGVVLGLLVLIFFREREIPYGPFLCAAAVATVIYWDTIWPLVEDRLLLLGPWALVLLAACLILLPVLLLAMRAVRSLWH